jgi:putative flippase GtrA
MKSTHIILLNKYIYLIKFLIVGCINTSVDFFTFFVLNGLFSLDKFISQAAAYSMGIINSFFMNKLWTFKSNYQFVSTTNQIFSLLFINGLSLLSQKKPAACRTGVHISPDSYCLSSPFC